jgi:PhnB protein
MPKVKPIPDGYHTLTPYLIVRGADKAIEFYKKAFGASERFRMPGPDGKIAHAEMQIGDSAFMLGEECAEMDAKSPQTVGGSSVGIHIYTEDVDAAFARAIKAGAKSTAPVTDMFWGDRFGKLQDPFGHTWSIATHTKDLSPDEMAEAAQSAFATKK